MRFSEIAVLSFALFGLLASSLMAQESDSLQTACRASAADQSDSWFGKDKVQHFVVSSALTSASFLIFNRGADLSQDHALAAGGGVTLSIGIGKEVYDAAKVNKRASFKDLVADVAGIVFAAAMVLAF